MTVQNEVQMYWVLSSELRQLLRPASIMTTDRDGWATAMAEVVDEMCAMLQWSELPRLAARLTTDLADARKALLPLGEVAL